MAIASGSIRRRPAGRRTRLCRRSIRPAQGIDLLERIGGGTLCVVYRARERSSGEARAVKLLRPAWGERPDARAILDQEARACRHVSHAGVVTLYEAHLHTPPYFLSLEWLDGETVDSLLSHTGRLPIPKALWIARQVASALAALAEAGCTHGDVKPGNLFFTTTGRVKLIDLGFARPLGVARPADAPLVGTANYLAPEQIQPGAVADVRSDLYSLGVTLYEMLAGELPFPPGNLFETLRHQRRQRPYPLRRHRPDLPAEVARLVESLLAKDPLRRPDSPAELQAQLTALEVATFRLR